MMSHDSKLDTQDSGHRFDGLWLGNLAKAHTWDKEDSCRNQYHEDAHEAQWESPPERLIAFAYTEVEPIGKEDTQEVRNEDEGKA